MGTRGAHSHARVLACFSILLATTCGSYGQSIPSGAFISGGTPSPPPPPPRSDISVGFDGSQPSSPPPSSTPATTPAPAPSAVTSTQPSSGSSSGLSGGAIAGIVVGAVAGVAIAAALAFLLLRRRRGRSLDLPVQAPKESHEPSKDEVLMNQLSQQPDTLAPAENPFMPFGLSWKPNEDLSGELKADNRIRSVKTIDESLSEQTPTTTPTTAPLDTKDSDTFMQTLPDRTSVIVRRGPGGALSIAKAPDSTGAGPASGASSIRSGLSGNASLTGASSGSLGLPDLPWSDWELKADDVIFAKDSNGDPIKLGSGAYGTVYKATIDGVTQCAVKMFHDVHNNSQQADILREVAILKGCRDRNIVQFLGACLMDERIMLVTELMESGDLWHLLVQYKGSGVLKWYMRGKRIAIEIARGLYFLHRHNIVHFDLKSPNVLLTRDGTAKVSDVGFANILSNTHLSTNEAAFTFAWAAPEVLIGAPCSNKVDMYSYGVVLWELITGEQPRRGMLREISVPEECPAEVEKLLSRCLNPDPNIRPSCKEVVEVLQRLEGEPAPAQNSSNTPPPPSTTSSVY